MPFLDVSDLLSDPDIAGQAFTVTRSVVSVAADGQAVATPTTFQATGSVQPAKSSDLQRLPEGAYQQGALRIRTITPLISGDASRNPDVIRWPAVTGPRYFVQSVDDWTQFGAGFVDALVTLADVNP